MVRDNIKIYLKMKNKGWLSIEKFLIKNGKIKLLQKQIVTNFINLLNFASIKSSRAIFRIYLE